MNAQTIFLFLFSLAINVNASQNIYLIEGNDKDIGDITLIDNKPISSLKLPFKIFSKMNGEIYPEKIVVIDSAEVGNIDVPDWEVAALGNVIIKGNVSRCKRLIAGLPEKDGGVHFDE